MTQLTLLVLVDAFRRDYLERTSFLRELAEDSQVGALTEDFGFVPRAAYFGGLGPSKFGFTNMFCYDPSTSPFGVASGLPQSTLGRAVEEPLGLRSFIETEAKQRVTPYAATYLSSLEIPIDLLPHFDLTEKRAPWDPEVGYKSVFHELADRKMPYTTHAWPETNLRDDRSDAAIVAGALAGIEPSCRFAYVHLQELDAIGHAHGPESAELQAALTRTDALLQALVGGLRSRFDRLDLVIFGDHGMVPVTGTIDVAAALESAGLRAGRDFVYFLDSTMARFWFPGIDYRANVAKALSDLPGRVLQRADLTRFDLAGCDARNGELIFLVDPGVLIMPNFFQRSGPVLRGMHGYDPACPDNQGLFLVRSHDADRSGDLGVVRATAVHTHIRRFLGLSKRTTRQRAERSGPDDRGLFTQHPDPAADVMVARQMGRVVEAVRALAPAAESILLTGSFGRGEGAVMRDDDGRLFPVNDYDVLVIAREAPEAQSATLRDLGHHLAAEFHTDFVHFTFWPSLGPTLPLTLANYDIRYGSRLVMGDPALLEALPPFASANIPPFEGVQLLFNRLGGLLTVPSEGQTPRGRRAHRYLVNQTMKGLVALGDWHLLRNRAYDVSYRKRLERFIWLASGMGMPADQRDAIIAAYEFKLQPDPLMVEDADSLARAAARWLVDATVRGVADLTNRPIATPSEAAAAYYEITACDRAAVEADNAFSTRTLAGNELVSVCQAPQGSVRQAIYASIPLIAAAWTGDREGFAFASRHLSKCLTPPWPADLTPSNWELVRERLAHAWLTLVH